MAATVSVKEVNGSGPTATTITTVYYCTSDTYNPGTNYPLIKPAAGNNWSYWKHHYLNADTSPTGTINNVKWYTDGSSGWTGVTLYVTTGSSYVQATGTEGTTGTEADGLEGRPDCNDTDAFTYTSASPLSVNGSITNPNTGKITDYVVTQMKVTTSAVAGALSSETFTFRYDET